MLNKDLKDIVFWQSSSVLFYSVLTVSNSEKRQAEIRNGSSCMLQLSSVRALSLEFGNFHSEYLVFSDGNRLNYFPSSKETRRGVDSLSDNLWPEWIYRDWVCVKNTYKGVGEGSWRVLLLPPLLRFYTWNSTGNGNHWPLDTRSQDF